MHFTVERKRLVKMLEAARRKMPGQIKKDQQVRIYACAARVFIEANHVTAGEEALVFEDGGCLQSLEPFLALIKSYVNKKHITIQADEKSLRLFNSSRSVVGYTRSVHPPAHFVVGRVIDTWLTTSGQPDA